MMRKIVKTSALATVLVASGCVTPPANQTDKLEVKTPMAWTATGAGEAIAAPVADTGWVNDFDDSLLPQLVAEAIEHNYDLQASAARLEAARAVATISGADRFPQISGRLAGDRRTRSGTSGFAITSNRSDNFNLSLSMNWEVDVWGKLRAAHKASIGDWQAAQEDYRAARLSLAAQTAKAWFDVLEADLQVRLASETLKSFESNLSIIEQRFRSGLSKALDVRLTRANVAGARSSLQFRYRQRDGSTRSMETLLGRYPAHQVQAATDLPALTQGVPAGLPSDLLHRRPDIVAAERRFAASGMRLKESRKNMLPSLSLTAGGGTSTDEFDELLNTDFKVWNLGANLAQPIFQGRRLKANAQRFNALRDRALADYASSALTAFREVETALAAEKFLADQEEALQTAAEESIEAEQLAWDAYQSGLDNIITVLEAQRRSFDSQRQHLQIINQRLQNRINLYLALGGNFNTEETVEEKVAVAAAEPADGTPNKQIEDG